MMNVSVGCVFDGRFVIEQKLGEGSYGQVFRATDQFDGRQVAIKFAYGEDSVKESNIIERDILQWIKNSDSDYKHLVVEMKTSMVLDDCVVIVMELLSHNLRHFIDNGSIQDLSVYTRQMLSFLHFMSQMGIIHADIKPENILHGDDNIKFADFGLSHCSLAKNKSIVGTPVYMAPELYLGYDYDSSIDTWSTGCVLVECLTKKMLFEATPGLEVLQKIALIIGVPEQMAICNAPYRDEYYSYNEKSRLWILKGFDLPIQPIGLRKYLQDYHNIDVDEPKCSAFVDLLERMLTISPCDRPTPENLLEHHFFTMFESTSRSDAKMELLFEICSRMNLPRHYIDEAVSLFETIEEEEAIVGHDEVAVAATCLYLVCGRNDVMISYRNFSVMSGFNVQIIARLSKVIRQILNPRKKPKAIRSIFSYCTMLRLGEDIAKMAEMMANRVIDKNILRCNHHDSIVAAAIFVAAKITRRRVNFREVVRITGAPTGAMRACMRKMFPIASYLLKE